MREFKAETYRRVASVVGQERYQFDIWGDTVNVAARMSSIPGSVAVTKDVWENVRQDFNGEALGEMEVKGKGTISVFGLLPPWSPRSVPRPSRSLRHRPQHTVSATPAIPRCKATITRWSITRTASLSCQRAWTEGSLELSGDV